MEEKMVKKFYSVDEFHRALGGIVTKSQIYKMIREGEIPTRRIGNKVVLSADWVRSYIDQPCVAIRQVKEKAM